MERLSGLDSLFRSLDSPGWPAHNAGLAIMDPSSAVERVTLDRLRDLVASRLDRIPPFRRRVVDVPFGLAAGFWIDDPNFDLATHFHRVGVPAPGGPREVAELVADLGSRPLDPSRPLWEVWLIEGLQHGNVAVLVKLHHTMVDGVGALELLSTLFDAEAEPSGSPAIEAVEPGPRARPGPLPSPARVLLWALPDVAVLPIRSTLRVVQLANDIRRGHRARRDRVSTGRAFGAPRVRFNESVDGTPHRTFAYTSLQLRNVLAVKRAFGVTVNDVVLALVGGSLRAYLGGLGALPDRPLVSLVPVNHRSPGDAPGGNRSSAFFSALHTQVDDPVARLEAIHAETLRGKQVHQAAGAHIVDRALDVGPPGLWSSVLRLYLGANLVGRHPPACSVAITNVGAVPVQLYLCGARVVASYAVTMVPPGVGLVVGVIGSPTSVDFGIAAIRELVPDPWPIADGLHTEIARLCSALPTSTPRP